MTRIQIRTDEKVKRKAQKVLKKMGLDLSSAINMYLVQIAVREEIPFRIRTENGFMPEQEDLILEALQSAKRSRKSYSSAGELHRDILGE